MLLTVCLTWHTHCDPQRPTPSSAVAKMDRSVCPRSTPAHSASLSWSLRMTPSTPATTRCAWTLCAVPPTWTLAAALLTNPLNRCVSHTDEVILSSKDKKELYSRLRSPTLLLFPSQWVFSIRFCIEYLIASFHCNPNFFFIFIWFLFVLF